MNLQQMDWDAYKQHLEELAKDTFWGFLGCKLVEINSKKVIASLLIESKHLNVLGIVHGGVHASLLDSAMGIAAMAARPHEKIVTTNLNVHYVSALKEGEIVVTAEAVHQTRNMITTKGKITNASDDLAALATGSFRVKLS